MKLVGRTQQYLLTSLFLVILVALPARATTAVMLSDAELIVNSRAIVIGRVTSVTSAWDDAGSMVWTYVEVQSDRLLRGEVPETIVLKQLGGSAGEAGVRISGQPVYAVGERVLLYLNTGMDGSLHAAHAFMGKFSIVKDATGREFVERSIDPGNVELLSRANGDEVTDRAQLDAYVEKIQDTLHREKTRVDEIDLERSGEPLVAIPTEYARKKKQSRGFVPQFVLSAGGLRWMEADSNQAIRYYVNSNASPVVGGGTAEIARAMSAWSSQSGASIQLQVAGQSGSCGIVFDNANTISFGDCLNQLDPPIGCAGVVALTAVGWTRETKIIGGTTFNRLIEADTVFNKGMDCFLSNSANLAEVACHELGHSIGLDHSADPSAIMWATAHGRGRDANLGEDDKAGVLAIYPQSGGGSGGGGPVSITTSGINEGVAGRSYSAVLTASGGTQPYRWNLVAGAMPPGLSLSTNGAIGGIPTLAGAYSFVVQVSDSGNPVRADSRLLSITIRADGGGGFPVISGVKAKGLKKLWVFGQSFFAGSLILINGSAFEPVYFQQDATLSQILAKGKLNLGPAGTNVVVVINGGNWSPPYFF